MHVCRYSGSYRHSRRTGERGNAWVHCYRSLYRHTQDAQWLAAWEHNPKPRCVIPDPAGRYCNNHMSKSPRRRWIPGQVKPPRWPSDIFKQHEVLRIGCFGNCAPSNHFVFTAVVLRAKVCLCGGLSSSLCFLHTEPLPTSSRSDYYTFLGTVFASMPVVRGSVSSPA